MTSFISWLQANSVIDSATCPSRTIAVVRKPAFSSRSLILSKYSLDSVLLICQFNRLINCVEASDGFLSITCNSTIFALKACPIAITCGNTHSASWEPSKGTSIGSNMADPSDLSSTYILKQKLPNRIHRLGSFCLRHLGEAVGSGNQPVAQRQGHCFRAAGNP